MTVALPTLEERKVLTQKPAGHPVFYQKWRDLLFMHYSIEPEELRKFIPEGLDIDLFPDREGRLKAWIGVVPFRMEAVRPRLFSPLPWLSSFPETNVRTYVHRGGRGPGVWFFSLDAARWIACKVARRRFALEYWHAHMKTNRKKEVVKYWSARMEGDRSAECDAEATIGPVWGVADTGTLDHFLIERYLLYTRIEQELYKARVWHRPYPLRAANVESCHQSLTAAVGLPTRPWEHVTFSDGVDVGVYRLERI